MITADAVGWANSRLEMKVSSIKLYRAKFHAVVVGTYEYA